MLVFLGAFVSYGCGRQSGPPYDAEDALRTFQIEPGFRLELVASEPDIMDPVAMEIDEYGRWYVVENPAYPLDFKAKSGRVKLLEDTDSDGKPDRVTLFSDELTMPTGVMRWKKGIIVTDAPDVLYLEDTNGDGKADVRKALLTGFAFTNPQHTVSNPTYGPDNWIYLAHERPVEAKVFVQEFGDPGGGIRFPERSDIAPVDTGGRNLRFRPDTFELEVLSSTSQFGLAFDEGGHLFTIGSGDLGRHEVIAAQYLERNPRLLVPSSMQRLVTDTKVFPITQRPEHQLLTGIGQITSACGMTLYLGGAFPDSYRNVAFVAEPEHNLVVATSWSPHGVTFAGERMEKGREFLASTDAWSRPVNFYVGPDGALYMLDYYRRVIEHPEWTSREVYESDAIYQGNDRGRIYRIVPDSDAPPLPTGIRLGDASDEELVKQLGNPNAWWRRTARRLLVDRASAGSVEPLKALAGSGETPNARLEALWTLSGLGKLDGALIEGALADKSNAIREYAIRLAEQRLPSSASLAEKMQALVDDADPRVRFQLLCTLGSAESAAARTARQKVLSKDLDDRWVQIAALSASPKEASRLFQVGVSQFTGSGSDGRAGFFRQASSVIAAGQSSAEIGAVLQAVAGRGDPQAEWWRAASLEGLARGMGRQQPAAGTWKPEQQELLLRLFQGPAPTVRRAALDLLAVVGLPSRATGRVVQQAEATLQDRAAPVELRADSVGLLALADRPSHENLFKALLVPAEPEEVQAAAARALAGLPSAELGSFLLERWRTMTPAVRNEATETFLADPSLTVMLIEAVEKEQVQPWTLSFPHRLRLQMHKEESIRERARHALVSTAEERQQVLKRYDGALAMPGDLDRGKQVFERVCSKCHKLNGIGSDVGPDLGQVQNRPPELLLADILMPSQSIAQGYEAYVVELNSGGTVDGVMGPQTPTSITIRQEEGKEQVIRRDDIKQFYAANLSAMPEDLEQQVDVGQMADLLQYLKHVQ
jgi:putative membrane-bound dehydrogenase-like protein